MRNPNGFGSVYKLPGNRRKPWTARVTVAHIEAHYSYRYLGYYRTQAEALMALAEYNRNPYDTSEITFGDVFSRFIEAQKPRIAPATYRSYITVYNNTKPLHDKPIAQLRLPTLQLFMDTCGKSFPAIRQIKTALVTLYEYALRYEYVKCNYAKMIDIEKLRNGYKTREKCVFTPDEIRMLWSIKETDETAEILLFMIYTGLRVSEMLRLEMKDVDVDKKCFYVRKSKTAAGVRTVPIADCILDIVKSREGNEYLYSHRVVVEHLERKVLPKLMKQLGMSHTFHETRHTFISMMAEAGIDERITKSIVGHAGGSLTESVYTHISIQPMLDAVNMLPVYK